MKLTQVKGNTWVLEGFELIPLYRLDNNKCILLDTGLEQEREDIENTLLEAGLTPAGILCSHAHIDHAGNNRYFQEKYHIPVALTAREAGMCASVLSLKCYFLLLPPDMVERESSNLVHTPDVIIPDQDGPFSFAGAEFTILHTPGHSVGHVCTVTPDNVCYAGDALLSQEMLTSKLPYCLSHQMGIESREKLRGFSWDYLIMAHRGVCPGTELDKLIDQNQELAQLRSREVYDQVTRPMTASEVCQAVCQYHKLLTGKPRRALRFERNIRFFLEFLVDRGDLVMETQNGTVIFRRP
ncbi:hypothetical protein HMPREF0866_01371 [Ruminococcaceae bacterium D16]|nr:hypothetical protein HMPREF0866_01371 [Ruminococcaceae bacterium D16]